MIRIINYFIIGIPLLVFFLNGIQKTEYSPDDTYIYLQYAKNIASGNGFSFNPGEQSYGVTSPLWVLFLAIPYFIGIDGFWFSKILDLISALLAIVVFYRLSKLFFKDHLTVSLSAALFILNPWFIRWSFTGMETSFAVLLVITIFYLWFCRKYSLMFFLCGLFYLTRPEGFLLTAILFLFSVFVSLKEKRFKIKEHVIYAVLVLLSVLPFLIYAKLTFGTFLPNTASGKSTLTLNFQVIIAQVIDISKTIAGSSLPELILSVITIGLMIKKRSFMNLQTVISWIAGLVILYIITDADVISRYLLIITPFIILIGISTAELFQKGMSSNAYRTVVIIIFCISLLYSQFIFYRYIKPSTDDFTFGLNECFVPIGKWLNINSESRSRILVNDVGAIGYYSERYIIDAAALVNRDLELNRKIMATPLADRQVTHRLLKIIEADYVIDRDTSELFNEILFENYRLKPEFIRKFPSLGISDNSPRYFKVYKVNKIN